MSELYRDFIDNEMNDVITALNGTITPTPVNSELYRDFLNRKADDVITALNGTITPAPIGDELYRDFIERKFDDVIAGIGGYVPPVTFPTLTGSIVTFNSQYAGLPLKSCVVDIPVTQEGAGVPSPDNVRNFVGVSSLDFTANSVVKTFTFGQTIYSGELDVLAGIFTATHKLAIFDGSENWTKSLAVSGAYFIENWVAENSISNSRDHLQNLGKTVTYTQFTQLINTCYFGQTLQFRVDNNLYPTVVDFKKFLSQNNLQLWYPLPTPAVINLGGMEIDTLEGVNNIWADTGDTTLQYIKIGGNT